MDFQTNLRILITGSNGLLGQKLVKQCLRKGYCFLATSKGENRNIDCLESMYQSLDIEDEQAIIAVFQFFKPTHVIHTAAITNVDACEVDPNLCDRVNHVAVQKLFKAAKQFNTHFQLLSTDFVFDGQKGNYKETDQVNPLSAYAKSKVNAENILLNSIDKNWSIVRTIIVYGVGNNLSRNNIVCWAKSALHKGEALQIVSDQFRAPTWADDLAWACLRICELNKNGIYHISGPKTYSIFDLVLRIANYYNLPTGNITESTSANLNQAAKRPPITGFDLSKSRKELGYDPKSLEQTLDMI